LGIISKDTILKAIHNDGTKSTIIVVVGNYK
jgi:hypothetical protein